ncbi:hypothetical protein CAPTEDRAFT_193690 [Capitella teleta]|uniref:Reverse transcriptase domain-containing protein n=1 Tax=Capitella teleta TaxID=283909 RepID=R7T8D8_CAPTE|nr:hypothetical protein CAPTEDRAFT_193690 [Capitella teleta]|eukprot:ELT89698.1 hypothetical protein CAPTEDRAFT_193690 [Capitella teleta]
MKSLNKDFGNLRQHSEETQHATSRKRKQENTLAEQLFARVNQFCASNGERRAIARVKTNRLHERKLIILRRTVWIHKRTLHGAPTPPTPQKWSASLDVSNSIAVAYLDFQKAFNTVPHQSLLHKLLKYTLKETISNGLKASSAPEASHLLVFAPFFAFAICVQIVVLLLVRPLGADMQNYIHAFQVTTTYIFNDSSAAFITFYRIFTYALDILRKTQPNLVPVWLPRKQVPDPTMLGFADARKGQHKRSQKDNGSSCPLFKPHQEDY